MTDTLWVDEDYIEITDDGKRLGLGNVEVYETYFTDPGELYRSCVRQHGRCTGKVYVGESDPKHIGWTFVKRMPYEDDKSKTYLQEVWVSVHDGPPKRTIEYNYHPL